MRTLAIGDIHGCLRALDRLLQIVAPQPDDLIVTLGDYIDRGPDSKGVLERVIELQDRCRVVALKGNHEIMMLEARTDLAMFEEWLLRGGRQTLQSYGADPNWSLFQEGIPERHWRFLDETCVPHHQVETHFFVHANAYADVALDDQPDHMLFWERLGNEAGLHESGKIMICGHTQQRSGLPLVLENAVCIDTWAYGGGWLTCLDVEREAYWQANQAGETRCGLLHSQTSRDR